MNDVELTKVDKEAKDQDVEAVAPSGPSGWQILRVYKAALLWSAFMGLAGINWGLDVMVCTSLRQRTTSLQYRRSYQPV